MTPLRFVFEGDIVFDADPCFEGPALPDDDGFGVVPREPDGFFPEDVR